MTDGPDRILRPKTVLERTGLQPLDHVPEDTERHLPEERPAHTRCTGWRESAIDAWIAQSDFFRRWQLGKQQ